MKNYFYKYVVDVNNMVLWHNILRCYYGNNGNSGISTGSPGNNDPMQLHHLPCLGGYVYVKPVIMEMRILFSNFGTYSNGKYLFRLSNNSRRCPAICTDKANPYATLVTTDTPTYTGSSRGSGAICMDMESVEHVFLKNFK